MSAGAQAGWLKALTRQGLIPPLDGLRAVAILIVLGEHIGAHLPIHQSADPDIAWVRMIYKGWNGIDLFMVLSGFLIGGSVFRAIQQDRFNFITFYLRRFFRIIPPYFAMILVLCALRFGWPEIGGPPPFTPTQLIPNLLLVTDYWPANIGIPTWSLSIEEHFYLLIPLLLFWVARLRPGARYGVLLGLILLAPLLRLFTYHYYQLGDAVGADIGALIHYPFHARMDSLAVGVLLALLHQAYPAGRPWPSRNVAAAFGLLIVCVVFFTGTYYGRWFKVVPRYTLLAIGFGAMLWSVLPGPSGSVLARVLSSKYWVPWARLAYAIFLTHLVVLEFTGRIWPNSFLEPLIMLVACIVVALPLFLFVEEPLHRYARRAFPMARGKNARPAPEGSRVEE